MSVDNFQFHAAGWSSPYTGGYAVTPSDLDPLTPTPRALWVGGTGAVSLITTGGQNVTYAAVPAGTELPVRATRVLLTGTTATSIVALY
jgi:hypothetical protein